MRVIIMGVCVLCADGRDILILRRQFVLLLGLSSSVACASYDMGLFLEGGKIHRYDMSSGAYLGSFLLRQYASQLIGDASSGSVYTLGDAGGGSYTIQRYNYGTGAFIGQVKLSGSPDVPYRMTKGASGEVLIGFQNDVRRYSLATGQQIGTPMSVAGYAFTGGGIYMSASSTYYLAAENANSSGFDAIFGVNSANQQLIRFDLQYLAYTSEVYDLSLSGTQVVLHTRVSNTNIITVLNKNSSSAVLDPQFSTIWSTAYEGRTRFAHGTDLYTSLYNQATDMTEISLGTLNPLTYGPIRFSLGRHSDIYDVIAAPEPNTFVALASGLFVGILKWRRKAVRASPR